MQVRQWRRWCLPILTTGILAIAASSIAQPPPPPLPNMDLTPDQKTRLRSAMDDTRHSLDALYKRLRSTRKELFKEFDNYEMNGKRIKELIHQMNDIQNEISWRHFKAQRDVRKIVTASQFEQLKKAMGTMRWHRPDGPDRDKPHPQ